MKIRYAQPGDSKEWCRMRTAIWPESPEDHAPEISDYFDSEDPELITLIAERDGGRICGFLEAATRPYAEGCTSSPVGYIEGWWVDPDYRRRGVGAMLVRAAEDWARSIGMSEMASDTVVDNRTSLAAHVALGYQEEDRLVCFRKSL